MRPHQEPAGLDGAAELLMGQNIATRMFVGEEGQCIGATGTNGRGVPMKRAMHVRVVEFDLPSPFITKHTRQFILGQNRGNFQESPKVFLSDQSIVFGINEEIVVIQPVGENPLVGKGK